MGVCWPDSASEASSRRCRAGWHARRRSQRRSSWWNSSRMAAIASASVWSRRALVFCGGRGKCSGNSPGISPLRADLVFRGAHQECTHNAKKISGFAADLVFRQVPGKSVQRGRHAQGFRRLFLRLTLLDAVRRRVIRVGGAPPRLSLLPPCCLALRLVAGVLPIAHTRIRPEPPPADRARPLPGLRHRDSSSPRPPARRALVQRWWVSSGEQGWVNSAKRLSFASVVWRLSPDFLPPLDRMTAVREDNSLARRPRSDPFEPYSASASSH